MAADTAWKLRLPGGANLPCSEIPKSMREIVLLGALHCDRISASLKAGSTSAADPGSLTCAFSLVGAVAEQDAKVRLTSDEDVRCFFSAVAGTCTLTLGVAAEAVGDNAGVISLRDFVAAREHAKAQESVRLNVGGKLREVHVMTAERIPLIAAMLRFPRDVGTPIFIDASPQAFDVLLELARGRSRKYVESLEPSLKALVYEYAEYAGVPISTVAGFDFGLTATNPTNKAVTNTYGYISQGDTVYTTGIRQQWNTVVGSTQIPQNGQTYWEVEVTSLGVVNRDFIVGVVCTSFNQMAATLDSGNQGWGLFSTGNSVYLRSNTQNVAGPLTDAFPITEGTRIGILVDADRGSLMFFHNGTFKLSHNVSLRGHALLPALSVLADTVLSVKTGLVAPL